jgi:hypothetical protein
MDLNIPSMPAKFQDFFFKEISTEFWSSLAYDKCRPSQISIILRSLRKTLFKSTFAIRVSVSRRTASILEAAAQAQSVARADSLTRPTTLIQSRCFLFLTRRAPLSFPLFSFSIYAEIFNSSIPACNKSHLHIFRFTL